MKHPKAHGFTLIESIIVIVILFIIFGAGVQFLRVGFIAYFHGQNFVSADSQGRVALSRMNNDLHNLRATSDITTASSTVLVFTDLYGNAISYQVSSSQLQRNTQALANHVQSMTFQYYDINGTALTAPVTGENLALIRYIRMTLIINKQDVFTYTTGVSLWNTL